jgi:hypothetical protein
MTDDPKKPRVRERVEAALKGKHSAVGLRQTADRYAEMDPTGAKFMRRDADTIEARADSELSRWSYTTNHVQVGNGGELVPLPEPATHHIAEHVREPADMLAHSASTQRMELATETDTLALGLDAANAIKARDTIERMLMEQAAAAHKLAMRFMAKAGHQLSQVDTWNSTSWAAHSVEAARLAHAAGKLLGAFNDSVLTVQRRRSGGKQVVQVIHQQVAVSAGGKAIVAGKVTGRRKTGGNRGGSE